MGWTADSTQVTADSTFYTADGGQQISHTPGDSVFRANYDAYAAPVLMNSLASMDVVTIILRDGTTYEAIDAIKRSYRVEDEYDAEGLQRTVEVREIDVSSDLDIVKWSGFPEVQMSARVIMEAKAYAIRSIASRSDTFTRLELVRPTVRERGHPGMRRGAI